MAETGPDNPNHVQEHTKSNPKSSAPYLTLNKASLKCAGPLRVIPVVHAFGISTILENQVQIPQIKFRNTRKKVQHLQLHISHQMSPYSDAKVI